MFRFPLLVLTVAGCAVVSGCSKKQQSTPAPSAPSASTSPGAADQPVAPEAQPPVPEEESPAIRLNIPDSTAAPAPTPAPTPQQSAPAGATQPGKVGVQPAEMVVFFPPFYPLSKRMEGIEGRIDLKLAISETGEVTNVEVQAATAPQFRDYAVAAAKDWKFVPARVDGKPTAVNAPFPVPFISEFGSGQMSPHSPLAPLSYVDGTYYTIGPDGRMTPANVEVTPLVRVTPAFSGPEGEMMPLRVVLNFTVTEEGQVKNPEVVESSGSAFDQAALTAVKYWQFLPQIRNGKARASNVKLPIVYGNEKQPAAK